MELGRTVSDVACPSCIVCACLQTIVIVFATILSTLEPPSEAFKALEPEPTSFQTTMECIFLVIFAIEFILKVIADGFIQGVPKRV